MLKTLPELFAEHPGVTVLEVSGGEDRENIGPSHGGQRWRIWDPHFACHLASLPGSDTEGGYLLNGGFCVHGWWDVRAECYRAFVRKVATEPAWSH